jgi:hypothetical protein
MVSKKTWVLISAIYDNVHMALWASLVSFLVYFSVVGLPNIRTAQARYQSLRVLHIAAEHEFYCDKLGMGVHKPGHDQCILDLQAFRGQIEHRVYAEDELW